MPVEAPSTSLRSFACSVLALAFTASSGIWAQRPADTPTKKLVPPSTDANLANARDLIKDGKYPVAEELLGTFLKGEPQSADAHYLLAAVLFHEQRPRESLAEYTEAARYRAPGSEELIGVAYDYILLKDYPDAERWLTLATEQAPQSSLAWYLLGRAQYNASRLTQAEHSFETCLQLSPRHLRAKYNLGLVYEKTERPEKAVAAYKEAILWEQASTVDDAQPFLDLGALLRHQAHAADALSYLLTAVRLAPGNAFGHQELALALEDTGRYSEAVEQLKQAIALSPGTQSLHFFLGRLYRRTGELAAASREFAEASRLSSTTSDKAVPNADVLPRP